MHNFIKRNQKRLLAVFGVFLMVAFLMPNFQSAPPSRFDYVVGTVGDQKLQRDKFDHAYDEWNFLQKRLVVRSQATGTGQWMPVLYQLPPQFSPMIGAIQEKPEIYYLLQYEAREMGLAPQHESAREFLSSPNADVGVSQPNGSVIGWTNLVDETQKGMAERSMANLIMVITAFGRAMDSVKVSDPLVTHELAQRLQQIKVRVVDFPVKEYESKVGTPTAEQLQQQFDKFSKNEANTEKGPSNPFGFGYKYPNRVKVQYISIPRTQIRKTVQATKDTYAWDVEANRYYLQHQSEFPTTAPATTQEALSLGPTVRQGPTTQPFAEVRQTILDRLIEPQANRLQLQIQSDISARLAQDYQAYKAKGPTSGPATAPAMAYESFEYLQKLASEMEAKHKVTLTVASVADAFRDIEQLRELPGIGEASSFPEYALTTIDPFMAPQIGNQAAVVSVFEPSKPLSDNGGSTHYFRVIAAETSHSPATMDEVKDKVEQDWKRLTAFEAARADANKMLDAAKQPGLDVVAGDRKLIMTGFYGNSPMIPIPDYPLATQSQTDFAKQTFDLLSILAAKDHPRPLVVVDMATDAKVAVAELIAVESGLSSESAERIKQIYSSQVAMPFSRMLVQNWFDIDSITERIGFKDETGRLTNKTP